MVMKLQKKPHLPIFATIYDGTNIREIIDLYFKHHSYKSVSINTETLELTSSSWDGVETERSRVEVGWYIVRDGAQVMAFSPEYVTLNYDIVDYGPTPQGYKRVDLTTRKVT
jgi:hypothetical protein